MAPPEAADTLRQLAKRLKDGRLDLIEVPDPGPGPREVAVRVHASVVSAGTERATLTVAEKGLLAKARARPDQARQVIEKVRSDGIRSTVSLVKERLEEWSPLGYSAAGEVLETGGEVTGLTPGDRVAIAGEGAGHAELAIVPHLLCARVPEGVAAEDAAFATLGAIALNGIRRAELSVGSRVAVIGLGLIGQLAVRCAIAAGARVLGIDVREDRVALAERAGAQALTRDALGEPSSWDSWADAALICAATESADPVSVAARLSRDGGRVVILGDVAMELPRAPFYEKELELRLSRAYGPGRYDPDYELHGHDYPISQVRWTAQRNMEAFLELVSAGRVDPGELITHRYSFGDAKEAFEVLKAEPAALGIVLRYDEAKADVGAEAPAPAAPASRRPAGGRAPRFGLIGPGAFATATILPGLARAGFEPAAVASSSGLSAESVRRRFGFDDAYSDPGEVIERDDVDLVVISTRHDSHASLAIAALAAGKPTYVEKPLALSGEELNDVANAAARSAAPLFVGFNRRHSRLAESLRALPGPRSMTYRVNAGRIGRDHWLNDLRLGGGRLVGEGCHFIDFLIDQAGSDPISVYATGFESEPGLGRDAADNFTLQVSFADGSVGVVQYAADAPSGPGKERFEVSTPGALGVIEDFRGGSIWRAGSQEKLKARGQDKGFDAQYRLLFEVARGAVAPPPHESFLITTLATLAARRSLRTGQPEPVVESLGTKALAAPGERAG